MNDMTDDALSPTRPYLLRAMHEWMSDNNQTPLIVVDTKVEDVIVPAEHVQDDRIILNVSWSATQNLVLGNEQISFSARFSGVSFSILVPVNAVQGIYARESGQGMMFQDDPTARTAESQAVDSSGDNDGGNNDDDKPPKRRGGLRVVK